jgi:hypothetical protein
MGRRRHGGLATSLYSAIRDQRVYQDPLQTKSFYEPLLHHITVWSSIVVCQRLAGE